MDDALSLVLSVCVLVASALVQPSRVFCPRGWWISDGVTRAGEFTCRPERIGCDYQDQICEQPPGFITGRIYCGPGFEPAQTHEGDGARCTRQPRW